MSRERPGNWKVSPTVLNDSFLPSGTFFSTPPEVLKAGGLSQEMVLVGGTFPNVPKLFL